MVLIDCLNFSDSAWWSQWLYLQTVGGLGDMVQLLRNFTGSLATLYLNLVLWHKPRTYCGGSFFFFFECSSSFKTNHCWILGEQGGDGSYLSRKSQFVKLKSNNIALQMEGYSVVPGGEYNNEAMMAQEFFTRWWTESILSWSSRLKRKRPYSYTVALLGQFIPPGNHFVEFKKSRTLS